MCGAPVGRKVTKCLVCGEVFSGSRGPARELSGAQPSASWLARYPNASLAAFAIGLPVVTGAALVTIEGIVIAVLGHTFSEPVAIVGILIFAVAGYVPFLVLPFAGWRAFRDHRRRSHVNPPAPNPDATPDSD
jgi:hypothetical protein